MRASGPFAQQMPRKPKNEVAGMWINPYSTLSRGHIVWDRRKTDAVNARYLDLADVALRANVAKQQEPRGSFAPVDDTPPQLTKSKSKKATAAVALSAPQPKPNFNPDINIPTLS